MRSPIKTSASPTRKTARERKSRLYAPRRYEASLTMGLVKLRNRFGRRAFGISAGGFPVARLSSRTVIGGASPPPYYICRDRCERFSLSQETKVTRRE